MHELEQALDRRAHLPVFLLRLLHERLQAGVKLLLHVEQTVRRDPRRLRLRDEPVEHILDRVRPRRAARVEYARVEQLRVQHADVLPGREGHVERRVDADRGPLWADVVQGVVGGLAGGCHSVSVRVCY